MIYLKQGIVILLAIPCFVSYNFPMSNTSQNPLIIGLTGSFGSGCTYIAKNVFEESKFCFVSLSRILKDMFDKQKRKKPSDAERRELQDFGDELRKLHGADYFARQALIKIKNQPNEDCNKTDIIDSIRNPAEVHAFRQFSNRFFLFGVFAHREVRWKRVNKIYDGNYNNFIADDENDSGKNNKEYGQRVGDCFYEADIVFSNNVDFDVINNEDFNKFKDLVMEYNNLVTNPLRRKQPKQYEALMTAAYAVSQRSSCLQRKVGAVIVDEFGNIVSSGFNEVPAYEQPCKSKFNRCFRKHTLEDLVNQFSSNEEDKIKFNSLIRANFKILDHCRALHAEENAIVNLAKYGVSVPLDKCILFTTTYPCRLCANKIVNLGIKKIVYLEPYPDVESKKILDNAKIDNEFFEGITFRAFFRIYGEKR